LQYRDERDLELVMSLIDNELSEPYSIFTYRYFLRNWPNLCFMAFDAATGRCFACAVAKMDVHRQRALRGYVAMLVVEKQYRHLGVGERWRRPAMRPQPVLACQGFMLTVGELCRAGSALVRRVIEEMAAGGCEEVALEAEVTNAGALALYEKLGFLRDKRLQRYYLNGNDAYRLKLLLPRGAAALRAAAALEEVAAAAALSELKLEGSSLAAA
jgi:peptide alpha-N-acetyltransferase